MHSYVYSSTYAVNTYSARGVKSPEFNESLNVSVERLLIFLLSNSSVPTGNPDLHVVGMLE